MQAQPFSLLENSQVAVTPENRRMQAILVESSKDEARQYDNSRR